MLNRGGWSALTLVVTLSLSGCAVHEQPVPTPVPSSEVAPVPQPPPITPSAPVEAVIGTSVRGSDIRTLTIGHGPRKVLFINGIHGDETETNQIAAELPAAFTDAGLGDAVTLTVIADANPDGHAAHTRGNANGVDVNRNFPASNFDPATDGTTPLSQPESRAIADVIDRTKPDLVLSAHSWLNDQFINFDGPAAQIAQRFAESSGLTVRESSSFAPTPGSLGSYVGRDLGVPIVTIEVRRGSDPAQVWQQVRDAVIAAISG